MSSLIGNGLWSCTLCSHRSKGSPSRWTRRRPHGIVRAMTRARIAVPLSTPASCPRSACWVTTRTRRPAPASPPRPPAGSAEPRAQGERGRLARQLPERRAGVCALASTCGGFDPIAWSSGLNTEPAIRSAGSGSASRTPPRACAGTEGGDVERCGGLASHGEHFKLFAEYRRAVADRLPDNSPWRHW
jgi:hypothetical protein